LVEIVKSPAKHAKVLLDNFSGESDSLFKINMAVKEWVENRMPLPHVISNMGD
jgi:hypothetical protein